MMMMMTMLANRYSRNKLNLDATCEVKPYVLVWAPVCLPCHCHNLRCGNALSHEW